MARRLVAGAVGILLLILIILGVKGCLDARKQRSLENFQSDVKSLVQSTDQLSTDFFKLLNDPSSSGSLSFTAALDNISGSAEGLLQRAEQLSTPGELGAAKSNLVLSYQLRRDGIAGFAAALASGGSAGSPKAAQDAQNLAVDHLKEILAGDVLYVHAKTEIDQVLSNENISGSVPASVFMQDPTRWLDPTQIAPLLASAGSTGLTGSACPPKATCGLGLTSTSIGGVALTPGAAATVTGSSVDVSVQNQGNVKESGIQVSVQVSGSGSQTATIPSIAAGATKTASVSLKPAPPSGRAVTLTVNVTPVPGEHVTTNNKATYSLTFG